MSTEWEVQKAIFAAVDAGVSVTVYDEVPDNTDAPYVTIGDSTSVPWDTDNSLGEEITVTIHSWSEYRGMKEVKELMGTIKGILHNQTLSITGNKCVLILQEFAEVVLDSDGRTRHGVQRFRLVTEEN